MHAFFRDEMIVAVSDLTTPSHQKLHRLIAMLRQRDDTQIVSDFAPLQWHDWAEIHDKSFVLSVAAADQATFDSATIPVSKLMADSVAFGGGSMIAAANEAIKKRCAFSPSSGFHHAHWDHPGPLCLLNALPLTALHILKQPSFNRVLILDCDYHRGDGTDDILMRLGDDRITHESLGFRYSRRQDAEDYLSAINQISIRIKRQEFDFVIYQAGMDVLLGDPAGGGLLTLAQARDRDQMIFAACERGAVPIVWNLAGGYPRDRDDGYDALMKGHLNTLDCAIETFGGST